MSYCKYVQEIKDAQDLHKIYHDTQYGFPIESDDELFGRLLLEINQAGLSWSVILKKQATFRVAYHNFSIEKIAAYDQKERERLLNDSGIIRNKLKVNAAIENAKTILELRKEFGSFKGWLEYHHPKDRATWTKLFKKTFKFTGGEIVNEFLMSTGYLPGAHETSCPIYQKVLASKPDWLG